MKKLLQNLQLDQLTKWQRIFLIFGGVILLLSFVPRFYDIMKFLPDYSIDENEIVEFAVSYYGGDLDPRFYSYGPLLSYILAVIYWIMSWFHPGGIDEFAQNVFFNNTQFYYTARFVNSLIAIATGYVVFKIVRMIWDKNTAYFALPLLLFPFAEIMTGFYARVDTLLGLCYALALLYTLKYYQKQKFLYVALIAIFAGMGFAVKPLPSVFILPSVILTFCLIHINQNIEGKKHEKKSTFIAKFFKSIPLVLNDKRFYFLIILMIVSSYIFFPHAFKNWGAANGFKEQQVTRVLYEGGKTGLHGWRLDSYLGQTGIVFIIVSIVGLFYGLWIAFKKINYKLLIALLLPLASLLVFSKGPARGYWYVVLVYFLVIGIVALFNEILSHIKLKKNRVLIGVIAIILLIFIPSKQLINRSKKLNSKADYTLLCTSLTAKQWVEKNIPAQKTIAMYGYFTSLPRLVDKNLNTQARFGDYFMYYRGGNKYYVNLFVKAHRTYVKSPKNKTYRIIRSFNFVDRNKKKQSFYLRYQNKQLEPYLPPLLKNIKADYLISVHKLDKRWNKRLIKSFMRKDIPFGADTYIYKIK